jgi:hypothetical protein
VHPWSSVSDVAIEDWIAPSPSVFVAGVHPWSSVSDVAIEDRIDDALSGQAGGR